MPENREAATDDLEARFGALVDDVGTRSRWPGADAAVRAAGRRRTTAAAGFLVVVLLAAGGVAGWTLQGRQTGVPVAGPSTSVTVASSSAAPEPVPSPARVTLHRLNQASAGWTVWETGTADVTDVGYCLSKEADLPEPIDDGTVDDYRVRGLVDASLERSRFASAADSASLVRERVRELESCPEKTTSRVVTLSPDLTVVAYVWGTGKRRGMVWLVSFGDRTDMFQVIGAPPPSDQVLERVSRLLAADVQTR